VDGDDYLSVPNLVGDGDRAHGDSRTADRPVLQRRRPKPGKRASGMSVWSKFMVRESCC
jgi:hypothetical protein